MALLVASVSSPAGAADKGHPVSEFLLGVLHHDAGVISRSKEDGPDVNVEWRFDALEGVAFWEAIRSPRPTLGANINTRGDTSSIYLALTWSLDLPAGFFLDASFGGGVHDGKLATASRERKELGTRGLFYLAAGLGYRFLEHHSISLRVDHMSNADLVGDNSGLDTVGLRYSYRF